MEYDNRVTIILRDMSKSELKHYCIDNGITMSSLLNDGLALQMEVLEGSKKPSKDGGRPKLLPETEAQSGGD